MASSCDPRYMFLQGVCFHLYSKTRSSGLSEYQLPELQRSPLDELSLQVMHLQTDSTAAALRIGTGACVIP